jgi:hypothetical protein
VKRPQNPRSRRPPRPVDVWRSPAPLPDVERVRVPQNVVAMVRSLGDPPVHGTVDARDYFERVIERASAVATALALSADLLAEAED